MSVSALGCAQCVNLVESSLTRSLRLQLFTLADVAVHYQVSNSHPIPVRPLRTRRICFFQCIVCKEIPEMATSALRVMWSVIAYHLYAFLLTMGHSASSVSSSGHIICATCIDPLRTPAKCYLCSRSILGRSDWTYAQHPAIER